MKTIAKLNYFLIKFKEDQRGASHFLEIAGGLIIVAAIVTMAKPALTKAITDIVSKAVTQITAAI